MNSTAAQPDPAPARIAIFDLDRTITRAGTYTPFLLSSARATPSRYMRIPTALTYMGAYAAKRISRAALKAHMLDLFIAGATRAQVEVWAETFVDRWLQVQVRPGALQAIERHRAAGDYLVMATASFDFYAEVFARRLGLHHTIATASVWDTNDCLCAAVAGENCYGPAKVEAVESYLKSYPSRPHITVYSDHHSDFDLLASADEGVAVNPNGKLRALARNEGLAIVDWG
ncbi:MAG: HAD-IB family hydrolase [Rhodospirillaceae bacterium]